MRVTADNIEGSKPKDILEKVRQANGAFELLLPLPSVGRTNDPGNIASDYADALLVAEKLAPYSIGITSGREYKDYFCSILFRIILHPEKAEEAVEICHDLVYGLYVSDDDGWARSEALEMEDRLYWQDPTLCLHFPDLADDYMANLLHASDIWNENPGSRKEYREKFPETKYGYWKSFASKQFGFPLYCSSRAWAAPPTFDLSAALCAYGFGEPRPRMQLDPAKVCRIDGQSTLLISEHQACPIPYSAIKDAAHFTSRLRPFGATQEAMGRSWYLSRDGEVVIMRSPLGQHVGFSDTHSRLPVLTAYLAGCEELVGRLRRQLGITIHTPCVWDKLNDELFEQLCYDVTRRMARFDEFNIRKMGNSRSRDGGRDIVAMTRSRPGSTPRKWIIQCKLVTSRRSLSGSAVNISDTIDQYGADGYMVFTNAVIDPTLYDKLDAIGRNRKIEHDAWSGLELERFLQGHRDLLARYFRDSPGTTHMASSTETTDK